jgi:hypothetical protein
MSMGFDFKIRVTVPNRVTDAGNTPLILPLCAAAASPSIVVCATTPEVLKINSTGWNSV